MKVREQGRIVSVAVIVAVAVNGDGRREVLGISIGGSEAETFWTEFLRSLARRGLRGVKPGRSLLRPEVISDAHEGLKAAVAKVLHASWQRCRVHFMRNVLAYAGRQGRRVVAAFWPSPADGTVAISAAQLAYMLDGIDWRNPVRAWRPEMAG